MVESYQEIAGKLFLIRPIPVFQAFILLFPEKKKP